MRDFLLVCNDKGTLTLLLILGNLSTNIKRLYTFVTFIILRLHKNAPIYSQK